MKKNLNVKRAMKQRGLMAKDVAEMIGITPVAMSQRINGNPRLSTLKTIADAMGCEIADLFFSDGDEEQEPQEAGTAAIGEPQGGLFAQGEAEAETPAAQQQPTGGVQTAQSDVLCPHCGRRMRAVVVLLPE